MLTPFKPAPFHTKSGFIPSPYAFPKKYCIRAGEAYTTVEKAVPAPYFRKTFQVEPGLKKAELLINGQGFYEATCNGANITKGPLAPYRANPDHWVYMDEYDVTAHLVPGKNAMGFLVGNGLQCSVFNRARMRRSPWRSAVQLAFRLTLTYENGETVSIFSDESVKTAPSPIVFNDLFVGEHYDARLEQPGWDTADFDDSAWKNAEPAPDPRGEARICEADPIGYFEEMQPVSITPYEGGYIYDFGVNFAGICRLCVCGEAGQTIQLQHFERLQDGKPYWDRISNDGTPIQVDEYTCKGAEKETWMPRFTYHGFRYVLVRGVTEAQAARSLLTYVVMHSHLPHVGSFTCDNAMVNALQAATMRSNWSNFFHFPTDCPHREKMGWTGDAALSAEQMLMNFDPTKSYREWLRNIHKAMTTRGSLPGIVPTAGTTYNWGNGPAWDQVLVELPYQVYRLRGDRQIVEEAAIPLMRYLTFLTTKRQENGLISFGLGDWCDVSCPELYCATPLVLTDSIVSVDIARKAAFLYGVLEQTVFQKFAQEFADSLTADIRRELIDHETFRAYGDTQAAQAMALYYGIFTGEEFDGAFRHLLELIHEKDDHFACGILGARVLFRLLAEHGHADLALKMIVREDAPSYGAIIARGATALYEEFADVIPPRGDENHHMWGDISAWFYRYLGGIRPNPTAEDVDRLDIAPCFAAAVNSVTADYRMPAGNVRVCWQRKDSTITLSLEVPAAAKGAILLPEGHHFADGSTQKSLQSGTYTIS